MFYVFSMLCFILFLYFYIFSVPGGTWEGPRGDLGVPGGLLGVPGEILEGLWESLEGSWGHLGVSWGRWGVLGVSLERSLGSLGVFLEDLWES